MLRIMTAVIVCVALLLPATMFAQVPEAMLFQGVLTDTDGEPLDGDHSMSFTIYGSAEGDDTVWTDTMSVTVTGGVFSVMLGGQGNPLDANVFTGETLWLGVSVDGGAEMQPRSSIGAVPYATRAAMADNVMTPEAVQDIIDEGGFLTDFEETDPTVNDLAKTALSCGEGHVVKFGGDGWYCAEDLDTQNSYDGTDFALSTQACPENENMVGIDENGMVVCLPEIDTDTLAVMPCTGGQIPKWDETSGAWVCAEDMDTQNTYDGTSFALSNQACPEGENMVGVDELGMPRCVPEEDTLSALGCVTGQVAKWDEDSAAWICADDINTQNTYSGADFATSNQNCDGTTKVTGVDAAGNLICGADIDTQNTYDGSTFALSNQNCPGGSKAAGVQNDGRLKCLPDIDTTYDGTTFALSNQSCPPGNYAYGFNPDGSLLCAPERDTTYDGTNFALSNQSCPAGQTADGVNADGSLRCVADPATATGWTRDGSDVHLTTETDNVGIGVAVPSEKLEVNGTVKATAFAGDGSAVTGVQHAVNADEATNADTLDNRHANQIQPIYGFAGGNQQVKLTHYYNSSTVPLRSVTITVPVAGKVIVNASGYALFTTTGWDTMRFGVLRGGYSWSNENDYYNHLGILTERSQGDLGPECVFNDDDGDGYWECWDGMDKCGYFPWAYTRGFNVGAGTHTFNLIAEYHSGGIVVADSNLTVQFAPN